MNTRSNELQNWIYCSSLLLTVETVSLEPLCKLEIEEYIDDYKELMKYDNAIDCSFPTEHFRIPTTTCFSQCQLKLIVTGL